MSTKRGRKPASEQPAAPRPAAAPPARVQYFIVRRGPDGADEILAGPFTDGRLSRIALERALDAGHEGAVEHAVFDAINAPGGRTAMKVDRAAVDKLTADWGFTIGQQSDAAPVFVKRWPRLPPRQAAESLALLGYVQRIASKRGYLRDEAPGGPELRQGFARAEALLSRGRALSPELMKEIRTAMRLRKDNLSARLKAQLLKLSNRSEDARNKPGWVRAAIRRAVEEGYLLSNHPHVGGTGSAFGKVAADFCRMGLKISEGTIRRRNYR